MHGSGMACVQSEQGPTAQQQQQLQLPMSEEDAMFEPLDVYGRFNEDGVEDSACYGIGDEAAAVATRLQRYAAAEQLTGALRTEMSTLQERMAHMERRAETLWHQKVGTGKA